MATGVTKYADVSSDAVSAYIIKRTLEIAEKQTVFKQFAQSEPLPSQNSKTVQFTRYNRLDLPLSPSEEDIDPTPQKLSVSTVTAVVDIWKATVTLTDVGMLTIAHPILQKTLNLLGIQSGELIDREIQNTLIGGTNIIFPGSVASRGALAGTDKLTKTTIRKIVKTHRKNGAKAWDGKNYIMVVDPGVEADIIDSIESAIQYKDIEPLLNEEIGRFGGCRFVRSNFIPELSLLADATYADSATAGSLTASTNYYFKVEGVNASTGMIEAISAQKIQATGVGITAIDVTFNAIATYVYNLYGSAVDGGPWYLIASQKAASSVYTVTAIPASGNQPQATPPSGVTVHISYLIGKESFAVVDLVGMSNFKVLITPANEVSDSNPTGSRRKVSWKAAFKTVILNQDYLARVESASGY